MVMTSIDPTPAQLRQVRAIIHRAVPLIVRELGRMLDDHEMNIIITATLRFVLADEDSQTVH